MPRLSFATRLLRWFDRNGRHDLPWQHPRTAYRVWVSEIMLQQTQVATVIPYFKNFIRAFPNIKRLAEAEQDEVLHQWTGLGYYARARNLRKAARIIRDRHKGRFPKQHEQLTALPGIGRSTAGAILAQAFGQRHAILDGNVKRVLSRYHAVESWPGDKRVEARLWEYAESHTPTTRIADYTQAIMDLGATLCARTTPRCDVCPLNADCRACALELQHQLPSRRPKKSLPVKQTIMLLIQNAAGDVLLQQRPPAGLWGGLWSLPEIPDGEPQANNIKRHCRDELGLKITRPKGWPALRHSFSHFHLDIQPVQAHAEYADNRVLESPPQVWYNTRQPDARGLAAPVKRLLERLADPDTGSKT